jgi:hypothetical protein
MDSQAKTWNMSIRVSNKTETMRTPFETLVTAAIRAPSGDNTQPWRFQIDPRASRIDIYLDETRDPSPMNCGQRMARIALGAALDNILRTASHNGWDAKTVSAESSAAASVQLAGNGPAEIKIDPTVMMRVTNRRVYNGEPISKALINRLIAESPATESVRTIWITERNRLPAIARTLGQADALMFGEPSMRRAFLKNVRFDAPPTAEVDQGLSLASLELSWFERQALPSMKWLPNWLVRYGGGLGTFAAKARKLVESASGLCILAAAGRDKQTDLMVGQAVQRAWLAMAGQGLAVQPMMSMAVLDNVRDYGRDELVSSTGTQTLRLSKELKTLVPELGQDRLAFLLRFGFATPPSGRTGRLPLDAICNRPQACNGVGEHAVAPSL